MFLFFLTDEDFIVEETKKHKKIYFPQNDVRPPKSLKVTTPETKIKEDKKPMNFLFSNDDDMDDDSDDEQET